MQNGEIHRNKKIYELMEAIERENKGIQLHRKELYFEEIGIVGTR